MKPVEEKPAPLLNRVVVPPQLLVMSATNAIFKPAKAGVGVPMGLSVKPAPVSGVEPLFVIVITKLLCSPAATILGVKDLLTANGERARTRCEASVAGRKPASLLNPFAGITFLMPPEMVAPASYSPSV